jgi:hypothetical protein
VTLEFSADIYCDVSGKQWSAVIRAHPANGGLGEIVWQRHAMRTQNNAEVAMEAAWNRWARGTSRNAEEPR